MSFPAHSLNHKKILVIASLWPELTSSAAGLRSNFLLRALKTTNANLHFASTGTSNSWQARLEQEGVATHEIRPNDPAFDAWIQSLAPDIVIFERFYLEEQFSWRIARHAPEALRVLDTHDLHSIRLARERAVVAASAQPEPGSGQVAAHPPEFNHLSDATWLSTTPVEWGGQLDLLNSDVLREMAAITRSHLTWVVSAWEQRLLTELIGMSRHTIRLSTWDVAPVSNSPGFAARVGFCHIGNFRHPPNMDSLEVLIQSLWPKIRSLLPRAALTVYGSYPTPRALQLIESRTSKSLGVCFGGSPESARQALSHHRVNLAPLRFGAGIKGKLLDGAAAGTPSVTTPIGAEGLEAVVKPSSIAKTDDQFVQAAVNLHETPTLWEETRHHEQSGLMAQFPFEPLAKTVLADLAHALDHRQKRDRAFWTRAMILQDSTRATEYLSRWITLKNRTTTADELSE